MAAVKLKLKGRHRKAFGRRNPDRCMISAALSEEYGGHWKVGYGTARRAGLFGRTLQMGMSAQHAAYDFDNGANVAGRTVVLHGNPGPTLAEQAEAKRKKAEARKAKAAAKRAARAQPAAATVPAAASAPGLWARLWNPAAAAQAAPRPRPQADRSRMYSTPAAAERARIQAGRNR